MSGRKEEIKEESKTARRGHFYIMVGAQARIKRRASK